MERKWAIDVWVRKPDYMTNAQIRAALARALGRLELVPGRQDARALILHVVNAAPWEVRA